MTLMDEFRMDGRVAVVTGSGQGIGRAIAWGLADAGCDVAINARRQADLDETAKGVFDRGRRALVDAADIRDHSEQLADRTVAELGRLDVWVNNVGGSDEKTVRELSDTPDDVFRSQLELNLTTAFQGAKAAAARMGPGGVIVNIASGAGTRGSPRTGPYAAAKAGMLNMTETLALELGRAASGSTRCHRGRSSPRPSSRCSASATGSRSCERTIPLGRLGTPDDIAAAVVYLASPASSWVTGQNILVAGGRTQRSYQYEPRRD